MEKIQSISPDGTEANISRIAEWFPATVTEAFDKDGTVRLAVDFDLLRQELSDHIVDGPQERYILNWPGKRSATLAANAPIAKTLRPVRDDSVDFDNTKNIFIEGDNLDALKLLQESYLGKVKLIYIDPPYNTGNDFVYDDDFAETGAEYLERSGQTSDAGERLVANLDSNGRFHSDWLSMMYSRLKLARPLLTDDGIIAISIDDNEVARLSQMLDEIFGSDNRIAQVVVQANKGGRDYLPLAQTHEYLLIYGRTARTGIYDLPRDVSALPLADAFGPYEARELRNRNPKFNRGNRPNLFYPFYINPELVDEHGYAAVSLEPRDGYRIETVPLNSQGVESCWRWGREKAAGAIVTNDPSESQLVARQVRSGSWNVYEKHRPTTQKAKTIWDETEVRTEAGTREVRELFNGAVFDHPKPVDLLKKLISISTTPESLVLDFFAGSGSTAHAVMSLNHQDGGHRRFITVQLNEPCGEGSVAAERGFTNIAEIGRQRLRLAGSSIGSAGKSEDIGFRSLRIDSSSFADVVRAPNQTDQLDLGSLTQSIQSDRSDEDLLFEVILDAGLELSLPIKRESIQGVDVLSIDDDALICCFATDLTLDVMKEIASREPIRVVFRDDAFVSDAARINVDQVFRELSPNTDVKAI
ncbi:hypothetical protein GCM10010910_09470 [Microbacterium nanhaiense]|uniref:DNA methylase N-4/N-6 domain-containing protein n=1 Tax=Microbacterium nanhaiense TaxID=1301026 RepID=A0ABQ2MZU2_9MICO|nr:site-specific DNA-methyltransferase [Microbacterium nanhaiense]GGO61505.1 hypothetical protein GCM10010910_09470 [Microbacterium nanhaiense]